VKYLIHADGKLPNLALMKLSAYFRARGEGVRLVRGAGQRQLWDPPGEVYGSSIFLFSARLRARLESEWGSIRWGGTGVRVGSDLAEIDAGVDWEALAPDYSGYPGEMRSLGFTQRGCRLKCSFCVVPKKEGAARPVRTIRQIWRGESYPKKILLLDNDFFGQADWRDRVAEIREGEFKICLSQGINVRQVGEEEAAALASIEYRDNDFRNRVLYTAWDNLGDERVFKRGVELLRAAGVPPKHLRVYMLVGFSRRETWEQILYRFYEMVALGCEPYPMVYDQERGDLKAFQRWAIRGLYRAVPWEKYRDPRLRDTRRALPVVA
jgi:hypothetical protein